MRTSALFVLATILLCGVSVNSEVIELTNDNFNTTIEEKEHVVVMYYDPYNNLCKKFLPKFDRLSNKLADITFGKLNGEKEIDLADEQGVDDYPSFELFVWGVPIKYTKHDSISTLKEWIGNKTKIVIPTASSASDLSDKDFELYFVADDNSPTARLMDGIQKKHEDMKIYRVDSDFAQTLANQYSIEIDSSNSIFCRRKHDGHSAIFSGNYEPYLLETWIVANEYPDASIFSKQTIHWLETEQLPILFFFHDSSSVNQTWIENIKAAAPHVKGVALTVLADTNDELVQQFASDNGFTDFPTLAIVEPDEPKKRFLCRRKLKKVTQKTVINCLHDFEARDLRRFFRSEQPVDGIDRNVNYIVGRTFGKKIFSNFDTYNLVFFYNKTTEDKVDQFKSFAESVGEIKDFNFNVFNMDLNEHRQVLHVTPGSILFFSPDDDNIAEITPESITQAILLPFLEDKAPAEVFEAIDKALKSDE